jgi:plasmid stability protein
MATLYVENVPKDLYEAIRARARHNRTSISTEVLALLAENVPTPKEVARRKTLMERRTPSAGPFPSSEQMLREDRAR